LDPDILDIIATTYPRLIDTNKEKLRSWRQLNNGMYIEVNLSAQDIKQFCLQAIELASLSNDDWQVDIKNA
jgi:hypothetical protein